MRIDTKTLIILALLVGGFFLFTGGKIPFSATGTGQQVALTTTSTSGTCGIGQSGADISLSSKNFLADPITQFSDSVQAFEGSSTVASFAYATGTANLFLVNNSLICGSTYRMIIGTGGATAGTSTYQYETIGLKIDNSKITLSEIKSYVLGSINVTGSNTSNFGANQVNINLTAADDNNRDIVLKFKENTNDAYYGNPTATGSQMYVWFNYSTANFTKVQLDSCSSSTGKAVSIERGIALPPSTSLTAGIHGDGLKVADGIKDGEWIECTVLLDLVSSVNPEAATQACIPIDITVDDEGTYTNNGKLEYSNYNATNSGSVGAAASTKTAQIGVC